MPTRVIARANHEDLRLYEQMPGCYIIAACVAAGTRSLDQLTRLEVSSLLVMSALCR